MHHSDITGGLKRYWMATGIVLALVLVLFLVAEALHMPLLANPEPWLAGGGTTAAMLGLLLLVGDVVLPVPSSLIMIAHGALFGIVVGTGLSLAGSVGATLLGFAVGRWSERLLARFVAPGERQRAADLVRRWGMVAILVTRPVPLLAETVAIMAGASALGWRQVTLAAVLGGLPGALLYALAGAAAATAGQGLAVFALVLLLAGLVWLTTRWLAPAGVAREDTDR